MKKFLFGALACAMLIPVGVGLVGCGGDNDDPTKIGVSVNGSGLYETLADAVEHAKVDEDGTITYEIWGAHDICTTGSLNSTWESDAYDFAKGKATKVILSGKNSTAKISLSVPDNLPESVPETFLNMMCRSEQLIFKNLIVADKRVDTNTNEWDYIEPYNGVDVNDTSVFDFFKAENCVFEESLKLTKTRKAEVKNCIFNVENKNHYAIWLGSQYDTDNKGLGKDCEEYKIENCIIKSTYGGIKISGTVGYSVYFKNNTIELTDNNESYYIKNSNTNVVYLEGSDR